MLNREVLARQLQFFFRRVAPREKGMFYFLDQEAERPLFTSLQGGDKGFQGNTRNSS
jgi:hypothetical protein